MSDERFLQASFPDIDTRSVNGTSSPAPTEEGPDPFDPERLRLKPDFSAADGVGKALQVDVRKPAKEWFIRVHPEKEYYLETKVIELKSVNTIYLVDPDIRDALEAEGESTLTPKRLYFTVTRQGDYFFWPVAWQDPLSGKKVDTWTASAVAAAELAQHQWIRVAANQRMSRYDYLPSSYQLDPVWPQLTLGNLLKRAFRECYVDTWDHIVLRSLRP